MRRAQGKGRVKQPGVVSTILSCTVGLWLFTPGELTGILQAAIEKGEHPTFVTWSEKGLGLSIDLPGFKKDVDQINPDGRRNLTALHHKTGMHVSVTLEKVPTHATTHGCIEQLQLIQTSPSVSRGQDIALNTTGAIPTLEYTLHKFRGVRLNQKHVFACIAQDNVYADIIFQRGTTPTPMHRSSNQFSKPFACNQSPHRS
jgi:hypothetical protein